MGRCSDLSVVICNQIISRRELANISVDSPILTIGSKADVTYNSDHRAPVNRKCSVTSYLDNWNGQTG
jgi:hypothetical protein